MTRTSPRHTPERSVPQRQEASSPVSDSLSLAPELAACQRGWAFLFYDFVKRILTGKLPSVFAPLPASWKDAEAAGNPNNILRRQKKSP